MLWDTPTPQSKGTLGVIVVAALALLQHPDPQSCCTSELSLSEPQSQRWLQLFYLVGVSLARRRAPTQPLSHSPSSVGQGEKIR